MYTYSTKHWINYRKDKKKVYESSTDVLFVKRREEKQLDKCHIAYMSSSIG